MKHCHPQVLCYMLPALYNIIGICHEKNKKPKIMNSIREELYFYIFFVIFIVQLKAGDIFNWTYRVVDIERFYRERTVLAKLPNFSKFRSSISWIDSPENKMRCFCLAPLSSNMTDFSSHKTIQIFLKFHPDSKRETWNFLHDKNSILQAVWWFGLFLCYWYWNRL